MLKIQKYAFTQLIFFVLIIQHIFDIMTILDEIDILSFVLLIILLPIVLIILQLCTLPCSSTNEILRHIIFDFIYCVLLYDYTLYNFVFKQFSY